MAPPKGLYWLTGRPVTASRSPLLAQAFKTRQALADLRLAVLHGSDAEKPAELDGHQHVVRDFSRPEAEIKEQRRQAAQYEDRDATTDRVREPAVMSTAKRAAPQGILAADYSETVSGRSSGSAVPS